RVRAVDDVRWAAGEVGRQHHLEARTAQVRVAVPSRLADQDDGDLKPWAGHITGGERIAEPAVGACEVADECDPGLERQPRISGSLERPLADRGVQNLRHL